VPALGIYPTVESSLLQGLLLLLALTALGWIFLVQRRRLSPRVVAMAGDPVAPMPSSLLPGEDVAMEETVLRSLEQMEADLAALRGEVERLRHTMLDASAEQVSKE
jgi:hypothetical protein